MDIWAKKLEDQYQTLEEHTLWVCDEALKQIDDKTLQKVANISGWSTDKIKDLIFFSAYFHDMGKATIEFQNTIKSGTQSYHAMYSASILESIQDFEFLEDDIYINLLLVIALTHHSLMPYTANSSSFGFLNEAQDFFHNYKTLYKSAFKKECSYSFDFHIYEVIVIQYHCCWLKILLLLLNSTLCQP